MATGETGFIDAFHVLVRVQYHAPEVDLHFLPAVARPRSSPPGSGGEQVRHLLVGPPRPGLAPR
ncbi:hypothetical protein [Pseudonocardia sp. H11422]|uniref:hypothetical protein n=1 Tax=Pseudonocardia sp. H11422 TaxID=2835866 RepID=UPI001BDC1696|nr:hypothetical protein [Pseudonocardia sp. H11422]